jgi:hypothetical protein
VFLTEKRIAQSEKECADMLRLRGVDVKYLLIAARQNGNTLFNGLLELLELTRTED